MSKQSRPDKRRSGDRRSQQGETSGRSNGGQASSDGKQRQSGKKSWGASAAAGRPSSTYHQPRRAGSALDEDRLLYGRNPITECFRAGRRTINQIWVTSGAAGSLPWLDDCEAQITVVDSSDQLTELADTSDHQGVVAKVSAYPFVQLEQLLADNPSPFLIALDQVQDPRNLGSIARTAECVGADGLIICRHRSASVTAAAVKSSAGALEHLKLVEVRNLSEALESAKQAGCWVYGASANARIGYDSPEYPDGTVLVLGAEGAGLRPKVEGYCDELVSIPLKGQVDSLNVAVSAGVLMYEILQKRDK